MIMEHPLWQWYNKKNLSMQKILSVQIDICHPFSFLSGCVQGFMQLVKGMSV